VRWSAPSMDASSARHGLACKGELCPERRVSPSWMTYSTQATTNQQQPMSPKQSALYKAFHESESLTLAECVQLVGQDIYCNQSFYVGQILKRMIDNGWIERKARGVYRKKQAPCNPSAPRIDSIQCGGSTTAVMPAMEEWARKHGLID
jgi:hypothetical protein